MSDNVLLCVPMAPTPLDLVDLNRRCRWTCVQLLTQVKIRVSGQYVARAVFIVGGKDGIDNGCLGPPPKQYGPRGKRIRKTDKQNWSELYISGRRVGRTEIGLFLQLLCGGAACLLATWIGDVSIEQRIRAATKNAARMSIDDAVRDWPMLITDERQEVLLLAAASG